MTNKDMVIDALRELADEAYQQRVWCGDGGQEMSSFVEAICGLFDDSGLSDALENSVREPVFSFLIDENLKKLRIAISTIEQSAAPADLIRDPKMQRVRGLAKSILQALI
jgi:hypothetical protein